MGIIINIWISTNNGISRLDSTKRKFFHYDYRDGISSGNFIEGSACRGKDGTLYFGSLSGVCYFNPETLLAERKAARVQIIECKIIDSRKENNDSVCVLSNKGIKLPYDLNSFCISFSVLDYSQSEKAEYAYMVEKLGKDWTVVTHGNEVAFRNLSPGKYTFKVKARLRNQQWDEDNIATLKIRIYPPLWWTWWAKMCYVLLIIVVIYVLLRFYMNKLQLESTLEVEQKKSQNEQELNNERLRFYTNITHELRTPLTLILGPLEDLVNDTKLPTPYSSKIKIIHGSAIRLLNLLNQLLEFRKTETQNRQLTVAKDNIADIVMETGLRYKELNRNEKVTYHINIETKETTLYFDADIIATILNNLLSNAAKYTPEGTITLTLRSVGQAGDRYTEIAVTDTGYGIDAESIPHIFDRYYQVQGKHQASGTGIGLALVKSLSDLHEGILYVESVLNERTTFTFRILTDNTYPDALHKEQETDNSPSGTTEKTMTDEEADIRPMILVVEDNDDIRDYIATSFSDDYRIYTAHNGEDGLEQALRHIPDIIISDIMMPIKNGIELCKQVKQDIRTSHIPVILLTAKDTISDKQEGYESGADSYLTKPFSARLLHSRVNNLLESRRQLARIIADHTNLFLPAAGTVPLSVGKSDASSVTPSTLSRIDEEFLAKLTQIIEENIDKEELDMKFLCNSMNMSQSTFYRKIKGLSGISGNGFIRKIRLRHAMQLICEKQYNISEAAYACGFNSTNYFRLCFKEEFGMTPSEYLKTL